MSRVDVILTFNVFQIGLQRVDAEKFHDRYKSGFGVRTPLRNKSAQMRDSAEEWHINAGLRIERRLAGKYARVLRRCDDRGCFGIRCF
jgi:hypothetical protein